MAKSIFFPPKNPRLARAISIKTPTAFRKSIGTVKKMQGIPKITKKRALVLARTRATVALKRQNLSIGERKQLRTISKTKINI